ncbi:MAG: helix-turn-helix transcriptional regulator [Coriobacteriia bacterium]|nr:helix-turn-helix transcriptional regulator [Coriobacteriia bacterium]
MTRDLVRTLPIRNAWPLGFALQTLWTPLIVRQNFVDHGGVDIHLVFYSSFGVFSLIVALIFLLRGISAWRVPYLGICILSILCRLFASLALTLDVFAGSESVALLGAIVGAVGGAASMLAWGSFFKDLKLEQSMAYVLLSYVLNFFLQPLCYMAFPTASVPVMALLAFGGPFCLLMAHLSRQKELASVNDEAKDGVASEGLSLRNLTAALPATDSEPRRHSPFLGLLVAFAIYSLALTLRSPVRFLSGSIAIVILYYAAMAITLLLFWSMFVRRSFPSFRHMMQLLLVAFAIGFFLQPFAPQAIADVPPALLMVATALIYMLVWMAVIDIAVVAKSHPFAIVGIWGACYGCPRLLYYAISAYVPLKGDTAESALFTALLALFFLFVVFFLVSRHPSVSHLFSALNETQPNESAPLVPLAEWQRIAQDNGLSERECEVFYLACDGHSRRYIAEHLFISENTVKAHLKRIYAKIGIHSKYDLERVLHPEAPSEQD